MDQLTEQQVTSIQQICETLVNVRSQFEELQLTGPAASRVWGELSNTHAICARLVLDQRMAARMAMSRRAAGGGA